jgi:hypothetical protein
MLSRDDDQDRQEAADRADGRFSVKEERDAAIR